MIIIMTIIMIYMYIKMKIIIIIIMNIIIFGMIGKISKHSNINYNN